MLAAVAAAVALSRAIWSLTKSYVAYAKEISIARDETGLTVRTLSALKFGVEAAGGSFDQFKNGLKEFYKTIGDANTGSKEANEKLARLGLTAQGAATNIEGAMRQAMLKIVSLRNPIEQFYAAVDAFGDDAGPSMLTFIKSINGDITKLNKNAEDLGITLSDRDTKAAKEFNRSLVEIQAVAQGVGMVFIRELLPDIKAVFSYIQTWFLQNKTEIGNWAIYAANAIRGLVSEMKELGNWVGDNWYWIRPAMAGATLGNSELAIFSLQQVKSSIDMAAQRGAQMPKANYDPSLNSIPDLTQTPLTGFFPPSASGKAGKSAAAPKAAEIPKWMTESKAQAEQLKERLRLLRNELKYFGQDTREAALMQEFLGKKLFVVNKDLFDSILAETKSIDVAERKKKAVEEAEAALKKYSDVVKQLQDLYAADDLASKGEIARLTQLMAAGTEFNEAQKQELKNREQIKAFKEATKELSFEDAKALYAELLAKQQLALADAKEIDQLRVKYEAQQRLKSLMGGLDEEYLNLTLELREYTTGIAATRVEILKLSDAYKKLSPDDQKAALARAAAIDGLREQRKAAEEARRQYDQFRSTILDGLEAMQDGAGSFFSWMYDRFKRFLREMVAEWLASKFFNMFYKGGNQQAAGANGGGGGIGGFLGQLFGGGSAAGQGPGGTPMFNGGNFAAGGAGGGAISNQQVMQWLNGGTSGGSSSGGGGMRGILGPGGLFGSKGFGNNVGTYSGIGALASVFGSLIPGRVGGAVSAGGTGMSIGAMIGSAVPVIGTAIGAVVGGGIGALFGWLFGNKAEKRDKKEKWPQFQQGFTDSMTQLRDLINDVRTLRVDPESAIAQAGQIRQQMASGFGIQFESKKYQRESQRMITQRLVEADTLIDELRKVSDISRAASERDRRLLPEFAGGVYISSAFRKFNGMLGGSWTGRDTIPAMLAAGEMILNPMQQARVRSNAGGDPFRGAGIPGYADGGVVQPTGPMNLNVYIEQDAQGMWIATAESDRGQKVIANVIEKKYRNGDVTFTRRRG